MSDSRSPQHKRGSSQDHEQFAKGKNLDGIRPITKSGGEGNADAWKVKSDLNIEKSNKRADRV